MVTSDYTYMVSGRSDGGVVYDDDVTPTFGSAYISIKGSAYSFPKGEYMFYIAWGE